MEENADVAKIDNEKNKGEEADKEEKVDDVKSNGEEDSDDLESDGYKIEMIERKKIGTNNDDKNNADNMNIEGADNDFDANKYRPHNTEYGPYSVENIMEKTTTKLTSKLRHKRKT